MGYLRKDKSLPTDNFENAAGYWSSVRKAMGEKADHNKLESQSLFFSAIVLSIMTPLFIAFGEGLLFGKIVPATLSGLVTAITSWLQLRQPQKLWTIYRRAQRELENEKLFYDQKLGQYENEQHPDKRLAERSAKIAMEVHDKWEGLVPDTSGLGKLAAPEKIDNGN